jgi:iron(III) transport system substrate-binding protein
MSAARIAPCLLGWLSLGLLAGAGCDGPDAQPTEQVVLYCSVDKQIAEPILATFRKQTGVKVLARYDTEASKTTGLVQRLRAEAARPAADVFWSSEIFQTIRLADEGLLAPYAGNQTAGWPPQFADPNGRWHAFALRSRVIAFDLRRVPAEKAPRSLEDLLDPQWKGRVVMAQPQFGTTRGDVASWFVGYGPDGARAILRGLKANGVRFVQGNSTAVRKLLTGEADVALTDTDDVYVARRKPGAKLGMHPLDQGGKGALAIPNTAALIRGGPHPEAARKLMAFLLGEQVEGALARSDSHNTPIRPHLAAQFADYAPLRPLKVDYAKVAEQMPAALAAVREIFR